MLFFCKTPNLLRRAVSVWVKAFREVSGVQARDAERVVTEMAQALFGFTLRRCASREDAEDLAQEIALRAYGGLLKADVERPEKFVWTVAHHALSNYYRARKAPVVGLSEDALACIPAPVADCDDAPDRLRRAIAYLSGVQRRVVTAFYFRRQSQQEIASALGLSVGTVKWHLFEARKELKRTMQTNRTSGELQFSPVTFAAMGISGSSGTRNFVQEFFRSPLCQNICYCVRQEYRTVHEIADALGVSPVYVEAEVRQLEDYGLLRARGDRYVANFIIDEPTTELLALRHDMYTEAARLVALDLCDRLEAEGLAGAGIDSPYDDNFRLWTLLPYVIAWSGDALRDRSISFEDVATIRPDGGQNIFTASVMNEGVALPAGSPTMDNWCGPRWNERNGRILWQIDSEWCQRTTANVTTYANDAQRVLQLWDDARTGHLTQADAQWLAERGIVRCDGQEVRPAVVCISREARDRLLALGEDVKRRHHARLQELAAPYVRASVEAVAPHLRHVRRFDLSHLFHADGWFLLYCMHALLDAGRITLPDQAQRASLMTLVIEP